MEPESQKIISLLEEIVSVQRTSYNNTVELTKKVDAHRKNVATLGIIALLAGVYSLIISLLYFKVI